MRDRLVQALCAAVGLGAIIAFCAWALRVLPRRTALVGIGSVANVGQLAAPAWGWMVVTGVGVLAVIALARFGGLRAPRAAAFWVGLLLFALAAPIGFVVGHHGVILSAAVVLGLLLGLHGSPRVVRLLGLSEPRWMWLRLWVLVATIHSVWAIHRDNAYGSGSWDHGCMVHNFYRASRFLDTASTVLGNVDFLGDHFMIGIYLYAPIFWAFAGSTTVLVIQAINVAATAPAIYLIARHHAVPFVQAAVLALVTALSFGMQSAAYFDSHELTVGFGFLAFGIWAFETGRLRLATLLFCVFILFKESLGAYLVALGMLAIWRGLKGADRRQWIYGATWIAIGAVWFVLVNRYFMPALIASAPNKPEPHETFQDFGPTVFAAVFGILSHPMKALAAIFVPDEKLLSHAVLFSGVGGLLVLAPQIGIAALPLFAERFLSAKGTMWEMGYHYGAPLALYAGWASAIGWNRARGLLDRALLWLGLPDRALFVLPTYLLAAALLTTGLGYRSASNYWQWDLVYFAPPARKIAHDKAIALLQGLGRAPKLAVQNRLLPHLADRPYIYRLGDWAQADFVLLSVGENAWPWDDGFAGRLARQLSRDPGWRLVYAQEATAVYARTTATTLPAVPPTPGLGL